MVAVQMKDICKQFPGVLANDHINFSVRQGEVHCLLGENGSGKTTLMNVLFGLYSKDEGQVFIHEQPVDIRNPLDAEKLGIGMVHQHFMLIPQLSVLENIILGSEPGKFTIDRKKAQKQVRELIETYHFNLDPDSRVADISVGMKQRVEILKLLYRGAEIIIFDEPTAVLTPQEVGELFAIFRQLIQRGCTVIFITHKLEEIFQISDRVTVLRKGCCIGTENTVEMTPERLSEMMVGRQIEEITKLPSIETKGVVLNVKELSLLDKGGDSDISFQVRRGEIVGIAGIDGNGQMELEELLTGVRRAKKGFIELCGVDVTELNAGKRRKLGFGYIPSDRMHSGALAKASVKENFLLGHQDSSAYRNRGFVRYKRLEKDSVAFAKEYEIKLVSIDQPFSGLSGGNQQKVVLAREVSKDISFVLAAQPIRGLDIGAIEYVHKTLLRLRGEGKGILLISAELSELLNVCDRILVLCDGQITGSFSRTEFDQNKIGLAMAGKTGGDISGE